MMGSMACKDVAGTKDFPALWSPGSETLSQKLSLLTLLLPIFVSIDTKLLSLNR